MISLSKQVVVWFGLLCLVSVFWGYGGPEERKMKYYEKGNAYYQKGEYQNARLELKNAVQIDPEFVDGHYLLGQIAFKDKKFNKAVKYFKRVLKLSPDHIEARLYLVQMSLFAKDFDYALENVREVLARRPENMKAQIAEGFILLNTGNKAEARSKVENLLAEGHKDPDLYLILAATYSWTTEKKRIEEIYKEGISIHKESPRLSRALVDLYVSEERNEEAAQLLSKLIEMEPDIVVHRFSLAELYWNMDRQSDAEKILDSISLAGAQKEKDILLLSNFYIKKGRHESAERILIDALHQKPGNFRYRFAISDIYVIQGKYPDAIKTLEQYLSLSKGKNGALILKIKNALAKIYLASGDLDTARQYVDEIITSNQHDLNAHFTKGKIFLTQGEGNKAINEFRLIITENPPFIEGHLRLAEAHVLNKKL